MALNDLIEACFVPGCKNSIDNQTAYRFYKLPDQKELQTQWIQKILEATGIRIENFTVS